MANPERMVLIIGGSVLAIVTVTIAVVVLLGSPSVTHYPPDSPEGVVQRYFGAARDENAELVESLLTERARGEMQSQPSPGGFYCSDDDERRISIRHTSTTDDSSTVTLQVEQFTGSGLNIDRYSYDLDVRLARENGSWKIDQTYLCP